VIAFYRVDVPASKRYGGFVAGLDAKDGIVTECAPILNWARGKDVERVLSWVESKGGSWELRLIEESEF
jgi:hypothetical protein